MHTHTFGMINYLHIIIYSLLSVHCGIATFVYTRTYKQHWSHKSILPIILGNFFETNKIIIRFSKFSDNAARIIQIYYITVY